MPGKRKIYTDMWPAVAKVEEESEEELLLNISPGKLGLVITPHPMGGEVIVNILPTCLFKDLVEVGWRIISVDGVPINTLDGSDTGRNRVMKFVKGGGNNNNMMMNANNNMGMMNQQQQMGMNNMGMGMGGNMNQMMGMQQNGMNQMNNMNMMGGNMNQMMMMMQQQQQQQNQMQQMNMMGGNNNMMMKQPPVSSKSPPQPAASTTEPRKMVYPNAPSVKLRDRRVGKRKCNHVDSSGTPCQNNSQKGGPLCSKHRWGKCTVTENGIKCKSNARDSTGLCKRHAWGSCNFTDDNGIGCTKMACWKGGPCEAHKFGKCTFTENDGTECQNNATSKSRLCKSHDFGECTFTECENNARWRGGLCCKHDPNARRCRMTRGKLRCINSNQYGSNGYCNICCTIGNAEREVETTGGECHPLIVLLERMNEIKDDLTLTTHMSELQLETMTLLHKIRTLMTHDRFQPESFSVNESLSNLVDKMMKEILTDKKYKNAWVRSSNGSHILLPEYVRDTLLTVVKGALKGYGGDGFDYRGVLSEKNVHDIIDEIICVVKDKGLHVGNIVKGLLIVKVGSEGTMESEEVASTRPGDKITYPEEAFVRAKYTALPVELTPKQRGCAESIATSLLLGLGIGGNINVPGYSVPSGTDSSASGLYLMFSTERSLSRHHAARGTAPAKRPSAPPGHKIVPIETVADATTAAAAGAGGGVDDDAVSTTAAKTSATAGENTKAQFCGECTVQPSEVATATPTEKQKTSTTSSASNTSQDESSPEKTHGLDDLKPAARPISGVPSPTVQVQTPLEDPVEFNSTQYDDDDDRYSPPNVSGFPYESTLHQQRDCNGKDLLGLEREHVARGGVGNCDNNQFAPIGCKRGHSNQSNADGSSPTKLYQPTVSRKQLSYPGDFLPNLNCPRPTQPHLPISQHIGRRLPPRDSTAPPVSLYQRVAFRPQSNTGEIGVTPDFILEPRELLEDQIAFGDDSNEEEAALGIQVHQQLEVHDKTTCAMAKRWKERGNKTNEEIVKGLKKMQKARNSVAESKEKGDKHSSLYTNK